MRKGKKRNERDTKREEKKRADRQTDISQNRSTSGRTTLPRVTAAAAAEGVASRRSCFCRWRRLDPAAAGPRARRERLSIPLMLPHELKAMERSRKIMKAMLLLGMLMLGESPAPNACSTDGSGSYTPLLRRYSSQDPRIKKKMMGYISSTKAFSLCLKFCSGRLHHRPTPTLCYSYSVPYKRTKCICDVQRL